VRDMVGEMSWVDALDKVIEPGHSDALYVITDVRFPNEAEYISRNNGIVIKVNRPNFDNGVPTDHPSERHIATLPFDYLITNDRGLDDVTEAVIRIMQLERMFAKAKWQRSILERVTV
jgi:Deoxynucleotide monophosphate kinase